MRRHSTSMMTAAPTAPRFKNPEISWTLENLILSLLEKTSVQAAGRRATWWRSRCLRRPSVSAQGVSSESGPGDQANGPAKPQSPRPRRARCPAWGTVERQAHTGEGERGGLNPRPSDRHVDGRPARTVALDFHHLRASAVTLQWPCQVVPSWPHPRSSASYEPSGRPRDAHVEMLAEAASSSRPKSAISAATTWPTCWAARGGGGSSSGIRPRRGTRTAPGFSWR